LLTAFGGELERFTKNAGHAIYQMGRERQFDLVDESLLHTPGRVDVDDGVAVALRTEAAPIQVADIDSALKAEWALPMIHRGDLGGFVLLGNKSNNETYRPDEIEVLGFATHQLALDLVALRVEQLEQYSSGIEQEAQIREHETAVLRDQLKAAMQLLKGTDVISTR
jgi:GAF domain-containing protein